LRGYCGGFRAYHRHFAQVPTTTANKKKLKRFGRSAKSASEIK